MPRNGERLDHRVARQVYDVDGSVCLVCRVGTAAVCESGNTGGVVSDWNGERGAECRAVVTEDVEADVDQADRAPVVVGNDELLGGRDVLRIHRSCNCWRSCGSIGGVSR